jgi:hypothetical protein
VSLVVRRSIQDRDITGLNEIASHKQILLVRRQLDVVWANDGLLLIRIIETLGIIEVRDVEGGDVVAEGDCKVSPFAVIRYVGIDGDRLLGIFTKLDKLFCDALLAIFSLAEGVDDPDLTGSNSTRRRESA